MTSSKTLKGQFSIFVINHPTPKDGIWRLEDKYKICKKK